MLNDGFCTAMLGLVVFVVVLAVGNTNTAGKFKLWVSIGFGVPELEQVSSTVRC